MEYNIYIHHSKNKVGYFVEDSAGKVILSDCSKGEYIGYTEPLLSAVIVCIKAIPQGCPVTIFCPMIGTITTPNGAKRALPLRVEMQKLLRGRNIKYVRAKENDDKIRYAKSLVRSVKKTRKVSETNHIVGEQIDYFPDFIAYTDGSCNNLSPYGEGGGCIRHSRRPRQHRQTKLKGFYRRYKQQNGVIGDFECRCRRPGKLYDGDLHRLAILHTCAVKRGQRPQLGKAQRKYNTPVFLLCLAPQIGAL